MFLTEGGFIVYKNAKDLEYVDDSILMGKGQKDDYIDDIGNKCYIVGYSRRDCNGKLWLGYDKDLYSFAKEVQYAYCQHNKVITLNDFLVIRIKIIV